MAMSDEWFEQFIEHLERDVNRKRRAISELYRPLPPSVLRVRVYDAETQRLRVLGREARDALV